MRRGVQRYLVAVVGAVLAACQSPGTPPPVRPEAPPAEVFEPGKPAVVPEQRPSGPGADRPLPPVPTRLTEPAPAAPAVGRPKKPMPAKPLEVAFRCASRDERHHIAQADVEVRAGEVRYLRARLATPQGGVCEFGLPAFRQTRQMPSVELRAHSGRCTLRMWEQGPKVTLAYSGCEQFCTPANTMEYILPILYDRRVKRCN